MMARKKFIIILWFTVGQLLSNILLVQSSSTNFELLRTRVYRIERRIVEDISLLRQELYAELKHLNAEVEDPTPEVLIGSSVINGSLHEHLNNLKEEMLKTVGQLKTAFQSEKRAIRSVRENVQCLTDVINGLIPNGLHFLNATLHELIDIKQLLEHSKSQKVSDCETTNKRPEEHTTKSMKRYADCFELLKNGYKTDGIYSVYPDTLWRPLDVFCDMTTSGGGWTVFQRRQDGSENFDRLWLDYAYGFGNLDGEFWLGNEFVHRLTSRGPHELRIELEDFDNETRVAYYGLFSIGAATDLYRLSVEYSSGKVAYSFTSMHHQDQQFSTKDKGPSKGCSASYKGGFWYKGCHSVNINGLYLEGEHESYADGVNWSSFRGQHYSLKRTEMKFRPR